MDWSRSMGQAIEEKNMIGWSMSFTIGSFTDFSKYEVSDAEESANELCT